MARIGNLLFKKSIRVIIVFFFKASHNSSLNIIAEKSRKFNLVSLDKIRGRIS